MRGIRPAYAFGSADLTRPRVFATEATGAIALGQPIFASREPDVRPGPLRGRHAADRG